MAEAQTPATVRRLGWLHFWNDFTLDFLTPLLPSGVGVALVGVMEGAADAVGNLLKLVTGRLSDRTGRRVAWVRGGYGVNAVLRPLAGVGMLLAWPAWIVACRIGDRVGKGLRGSATDALVGDWTAGDARARAFARMRTMDHLGAALGGFAAAVAAWFLPGHMPWVVMGLVLPALAMLWLCRGIVDHPDAAPKTGDGPPPGWWPSAGPVRAALALVAAASLAAKISLLLVLVTVVGLPEPGLAAPAEGAAASTVPLWQVCLGWAVLGLVQAGAAALAGRWTVRLGAAGFLAVGWLCGAALFAALALAPAAALIPLGLGFGVLYGFTEGAEKTLIAELVPKHERATAFGALALLTAIAVLAGNGAIGWAVATLGRASFLAPAGLLVLCAIAARILPRPAAPAA